MQILPAIDLKDGRCVRLFKGDFSTVHAVADDPAAVAAAFSRAGARLIHVVDLDGARGGVRRNDAVVRELVRAARPAKIELGGGLRRMEDLESADALGVQRFVLGSAAAEAPDFVRAAVARFGARVAVGIDAQNGRVKTAGWEKDAGRDALELAAEMEALGVKTIIFTDIDTDGMLSGPNLPRLKALREKVSCALVASGGVASSAHLRTVRELGCEAAIVGKAIYSGDIDLTEAIEEETRMTKRIIPCMDVKDGRVVKGVGFEHLRDAGDPADFARRYCEQGADELVFLDITATTEDRDTTLDAIRRVLEVIDVPLCVGGGIRTPEDAARLFDLGVSKVSINTAAVLRPALIEEIAGRYGSAAVTVAIDARRDEAGGYEVLIRGGHEAAGLDAVAWARQAEALGAGEILLTSKDADGTKDGYDLEMTKAVAQAVRVPVIASGGCGSLRDIADAFDIAGAGGALAASLFHFGELTIPQVREFLEGHR